jgi:hypothetical protein
MCSALLWWGSMLDGRVCFLSVRDAVIFVYVRICNCYLYIYICV